MPIRAHLSSLCTQITQSITIWWVQYPNHPDELICNSALWYVFLYSHAYSYNWLPFPSLNVYFQPICQLSHLLSTEIFGWSLIRREDSIRATHHGIHNMLLCCAGVGERIRAVVREMEKRGSVDPLILWTWGWYGDVNKTTSFYCSLSPSFPYLLSLFPAENTPLFLI